jgi:OOP family OmpA-OmpF porin
VEGYTDSTGSDAHNPTRSQQRANAVATYLKSKGVDDNRLIGEDFGKEDPTDTNATQSGKADNPASNSSHSSNYSI